MHGGNKPLKCCRYRVYNLFFKSLTAIAYRPPCPVRNVECLPHKLIVVEITPLSSLRDGRKYPHVSSERHSTINSSYILASGLIIASFKSVLSWPPSCRFRAAMQPGSGKSCVERRIESYFWYVLKAHCGSSRATDAWMTTLMAVISIVWSSV